MSYCGNTAILGIVTFFSIGSVASCDVFVSEFERRGLNRDAMCPCAWSHEALTVAIKRLKFCLINMSLMFCSGSSNEKVPNLK